MSGATGSEGTGYPAGSPEVDANTQASLCVLCVIYIYLQLCAIHVNKVSMAVQLSKA